MTGESGILDVVRETFAALRVGHLVEHVMKRVDTCIKLGTSGHTPPHSVTEGAL